MMANIDEEGIDAEEIDAVVFDAGGVLLLPDPAALRRAFAPFNLELDDEMCRRIHFESAREVDRLDGPDWRKVDEALARAVGVADRDLDQAVGLIEDVYIRQPWVPVPKAAEVLVELQSAGYQLAVVSNAGGTMEAQLAEHRICSVNGHREARVEVVIDSHVVGVEKPDPKIFHLALDALDVAADRCLYVGDTVYFDVNGARAAGLHPVHVDPFGFCPGDDHPHIRALDDLLPPLVG